MLVNPSTENLAHRVVVVSILTVVLGPQPPVLVEPLPGFWDSSKLRSLPKNKSHQLYLFMPSIPLSSYTNLSHSLKKVHGVGEWKYC